MVTDMGDIRTVHASNGEGIEIVRYDRAGKWYIEATRAPVSPQPRQKVTIGAAVKVAEEWIRSESGRVFLGRRGGGSFDRKMLGACPTLT